MLGNKQCINKVAFVVQAPTIINCSSFSWAIRPLERVEPSRCLLALLHGEWGYIETQLGRAPRHILACCSRLTQWLQRHWKTP